MPGAENFLCNTAPSAVSYEKLCSEAPNISIRSESANAGGFSRRFRRPVAAAALATAILGGVVISTELSPTSVVMAPKESQAIRLLKFTDGKEEDELGSIDYTIVYPKQFDELKGSKK